jgi:hypothetical protein
LGDLLFKGIVFLNIKGYTFLCVILIIFCLPWKSPERTNEKIKVIFNQSSLSDARKIKSSAINIIKNSKHEIHFAVSGFDDIDIADALLAAEKNNVSVNIYIDNDVIEIQPALKYLAQQGFKNKFVSSGKNDGNVSMGHNIIFADSKHVWLFSGGLSSSSFGIEDAHSGQPNICLILKFLEPELASEFEREFRQMRAGNFGQSKARLDMRNRYQIFDEEIEIYFGPQDKPGDIIHSEVLSSKQSIDFFSSGFKNTSSVENKSLHYLIKEKMLSGLPVRGIFEEFAYYQKRDESSDNSAGGILNACLNASSDIVCNTDLLNVNTSFSIYKSGLRQLSANFMVIDKNTPDASAIYSIGAWEKFMNYSKDGLLIIFRGNIVKLFQNIFNDILKSERTEEISPIPTDINKHDIIISEILWMGSLNNYLDANIKDEFIEIYNNTDQKINLSNAQIFCSDSTPEEIESELYLEKEPQFVFPIGFIISPKEYRTIGSYSEAGVIENPDLDGLRTISNTSTFCELRSDPLVFNLTVDRVGDGNWHFDENEIMLGSNDSIYGKRSMERQTGGYSHNAVGISDWATNALRIKNNIYVNKLYSEKTFATPNFPPVVPQFTKGKSGTVAVSELLWMGSYDNNLNKYPDDEYIELFNTMDKTIYLSGWRFECGYNTDELNIIFQITGGNSIFPGEYIVIARLSDAVVVEPDLEARVAISNASTVCRLMSYDNAIVDEIGDGVTPFNSDNIRLGEQNENFYRSMERQNLNYPGNDIDNWLTNLMNVEENEMLNAISVGYSNRTFGTPGYPNFSFTGTSAEFMDVVINEVNWYGSFGDSYDEWIEFRNLMPIDLFVSLWKVEIIRSSDLTIKDSIIFPIGSRIDSGGYLVIGRKQESDSSLWGVQNVYIDSFILANSDRYLLLKDYENNIIDQTPNILEWPAGSNSQKYSMERLDDISGGGYMNGIYEAQWYTWNSADGFFTSNPAAGDKGTPGADNSNPLAVHPVLQLPFSTGLEDGEPEFEKTEGSGYLSNTPTPGTVPRNGIKVLTVDSITTSDTGRKIISVNCINLDDDTTQLNSSFWGMASSLNGGNNIYTRLEIIYFLDSSCNNKSGNSLDTTSYLLDEGMYSQINYITNPEPGAVSFKLRLRVWDDNGGTNSGDDWAADDFYVFQ